MTHGLGQNSVSPQSAGRIYSAFIDSSTHAPPWYWYTSRNSYYILEVLLRCTVLGIPSYQRVGSYY
jgi:hypothetical protein